MRLENDLRNVTEFEEGMHSNCYQDSRLTHFFLTSFICEEVDIMNFAQTFLTFQNLPQDLGSPDPYVLRTLNIIESVIICMPA